MKSYVGHHTCSDENGYGYVLINAPFLSQWDSTDDQPKRKNPYLGTGYYFWEYDVTQAKKWGNQRYPTGFFIVEGSINTTDENFLDLVGDKQKMSHLLLLATKLISSRLIPKDFKLGELIEYLKMASHLKPELFPYTIIRAQDYRGINRLTKFYFRALEGFTILNPIHIFCLIHPIDVTLSGKKVIFKSKI